MVIKFYNRIRHYPPADAVNILTLILLRRTVNRQNCVNISNRILYRPCFLKKKKKINIIIIGITLCRWLLVNNGVRWWNLDCVNDIFPSTCTLIVFRIISQNSQWFFRKWFLNFINICVRWYGRSGFDHLST